MDIDLKTLFMIADLFNNIKTTYKSFAHRNKSRAFHRPQFRRFPQRPYRRNFWF